MTAIVALRTNRTVFMGADSLGGSGYQCTVRKDAKLFRVGRFLIGYTSSFRMGQLLRFGSGDDNLEGLKPSGDGLQFMVTEFVPKMRAIFKSAGYMHVKEEREEAGEFIVAWGKHLFQIHEDLQVAQSVDPYMACGCGEQVACGSLYSTEGDPEGRIRLALEAAERHSGYVRRPFHILNTVVP